MTENQLGKWWVLFGLWLLYVSFGLVVSSVAPMVERIETALDMSHTAMGSVMGAWQLVYIVAAIPCGMLLGRIGARSALLLGALFIAASALGRAFAVDYWSFLFAVMLFGLGGPIVSSGAPKVVAELFTGSQRGVAMGIYITGPAVGGVVGLTLTNSYILPLFNMDWRSVMALWGVCALGAGFIWFLLASVFYVDLCERNKEGAIVPQFQVMRELISMPAVRVLLFMGICTFLFNHGLNNWLPEILRLGGKTPVDAGYWAAIPTAVGILGSLLIPRFATGARRSDILLMLCFSAFLATILLQSTNNPTLTVGLVLQGIARSSLMTVLMLTLVELKGMDERRIGVASGMFFSAAEVGGMLGPLGIGVIYDINGSFSGVFIALTVVVFALISCAFYLRRLSAPTCRAL